MIKPEARAAFLQLLTMMQQQAEQINRDFDLERPENQISAVVATFSGDVQAREAIAALASQQAAVCTFLITLIKED